MFVFLACGISNCISCSKNDNSNTIYCLICDDGCTLNLDSTTCTCKYVCVCGLCNCVCVGVCLCVYFSGRLN